MKVLNSKYEGKTFIKKKYTLTDDTIVHNGRVLHRIKATMSFGNIVEGTLGGYIQSIGNLSQEGFCWVYPSSKVYDEAYISGNIQVEGSSDISGKAQVTGYGRIMDNVKIDGSAYICGSINLSGICKITDNSKIYGYAIIKDVTIKDNVILYNYNQLQGVFTIGANAQICNLDLKC